MRLGRNRNQNDEAGRPSEDADQPVVVARRFSATASSRPRPLPRSLSPNRLVTANSGPLARRHLKPRSPTRSSTKGRGSLQMREYPHRTR